MSWRGMERGIAAAKAGHDVIMTPMSWCYFDFYQGDPLDEPEAFGGYTPLRKVYAFEPIPAALSPTEARRVLGAQGNVWTEFIGTPTHVEYMSLPRMAALAEVLWSAKEARSWPDFRERLDVHLRRLEALGVNYSRGSTRIEAQPEVDANTGGVKLSMATEQPRAEIRYTLDGSAPELGSTRYTGPIQIGVPTRVRAGLFVEGELQGHTTEAQIIPHAAMAATWTYRQRFANPDECSERTLFDGLLGTLSSTDGRWQGYEAQDLDVVVDLGSAKPIHHLHMGFLKNPPTSIHPAKEVEISFSDDGQTFRVNGRGEFGLRAAAGTASIEDYEVGFLRAQSARYVRVVARSQKTVPEGYPHAGSPAWMYVDEIIIE
jgi:hexosaminidase